MEALETPHSQHTPDNGNTVTRDLMLFDPLINDYHLFDNDYPMLKNEKPLLRIDSPATLPIPKCRSIHIDLVQPYLGPADLLSLSWTSKWFFAVCNCRKRLWPKVQTSLQQQIGTENWNKIKTILKKHQGVISGCFPLFLFHSSYNKLRDQDIELYLKRAAKHVDLPPIAAPRTDPWHHTRNHFSYESYWKGLSHRVHSFPIQLSSNDIEFWINKYMNFDFCKIVIGTHFVSCQNWESVIYKSSPLRISDDILMNYLDHIFYPEKNKSYQKQGAFEIDAEKIFTTLPIRIKRMQYLGYTINNTQHFDYCNLLQTSCSIWSQQIKTQRESARMLKKILYTNEKYVDDEANYFLDTPQANFWFNMKLFHNDNYKRNEQNMGKENMGKQNMGERNISADYLLFELFRFLTFTQSDENKFQESVESYQSQQDGTNTALRDCFNPDGIPLEWMPDITNIALQYFQGSMPLYDIQTCQKSWNYYFRHWMKKEWPYLQDIQVHEGVACRERHKPGAAQTIVCDLPPIDPTAMMAMKEMGESLFCWGDQPWGVKEIDFDEPVIPDPNNDIAAKMNNLRKEKKMFQQQLNNLKKENDALKARLLSVNVLSINVHPVKTQITH